MSVRVLHFIHPASAGAICYAALRRMPSKYLDSILINVKVQVRNASARYPAIVCIRRFLSGQEGIQHECLGWRDIQELPV